MGHLSTTMQTGILFLAAFIAVAAAQVPPTPCPSTPAQYCNCGEGDHGFKWLCRANNGYSWETNDAKPINPCPSKYPACNLAAAVEEIARRQQAGAHLLMEILWSSKTCTMATRNKLHWRTAACPSCRMPITRPRPLTQISMITRAALRLTLTCPTSHRPHRST